MATATPASPRGIARVATVAITVGSASVLPGFLVGALSLQVRDDLDVGVTAVTAGVTVFFGAGMLGASSGGRLAERVGALAAMRAATAITGSCLLAIAALAGSLAPFLVLLGIAGLANSVTQPAINLYMAQQIPRGRQGLAFGIKQSAIPGAILVSGLALPLLALPLGWRPTFALAGLAALLAALVAARERASLAPPALRNTPGRPTRELVLIALGAALASAGPSALSAYLVVSAVDAGIAEGSAGVLAALGSAASLAVRVGMGGRADRRADYGFGWVVLLLAGGSLGFLLLATETAAPFVAGAVLAFMLGWGWPGLFNLAVVERHREAPGWATGISQSGIYVGAAGGPAAYGLLSGAVGYGPAWAITAGVLLVAAAAIGLATRV
ncbi:MAG TPA: MFS transporter [Thermoleophilaceae bacterium]